MYERSLKIASEWWPALAAFASSAAIAALVATTAPDRPSVLAIFVILVGLAAASWALCAFKAVAGPRIGQLKTGGQMLLGTPVALSAMLASVLLSTRVGSPLTFGLICAVAIGIITVAWPERAS